eukprot:6146652-Prymnesium_polylepis.2
MRISAVQTGQLARPRLVAARRRGLPHGRPLHSALLLQYVVNFRARCAPSGSGTDLESHSGSGRGLGADPASSNILFTLTPGRYERRREALACRRSFASSLAALADATNGRHQWRQHSQYSGEPCRSSDPSHFG